MHDDGPVTDAEVRPTGRSTSRLRQTLWDMVRSMALVLVVVFFIWLLAWRPDPQAVTVVDPGPVVVAAARAGDFPISGPAGLPEGWRPTSARWEPTDASGEQKVLHIGFVTPADEYAQVSTSTLDGAAYLGEQTTNGRPLGTTLTVAGEAWDQWQGDKRRSLVRIRDGVTTIVSGTATWDELAILAGSLRPVSGS